jgi:hypothetical protein
MQNNQRIICMRVKSSVSTRQEDEGLDAEEIKSKNSRTAESAEMLH